MRKIVRRTVAKPAAPQPRSEVQPPGPSQPPPPPPQPPPPDWTDAPLPMPRGKRLISLRLDADVVDYFQDGGKGYQTRMNAVLRAWMDARKRRHT